MEEEEGSEDAEQFMSPSRLPERAIGDAFELESLLKTSLMGCRDDWDKLDEGVLSNPRRRDTGEEIDALNFASKSMSAS